MEGGWSDYRPTARDEREIVFHGHLVVKADIARSLTDDNLARIQWWVLYKKFGWPWAGGWAEQPAVYFDVVEALEAEADRIADEKRKQAESKRGQRHR